MTCPSCGAEHDSERKFCTVCGAPLTRACPSCGAAAEPEDQFCGECGTPLQEAAPAAATAVAPQVAAVADPGERRFVTVMFADLVGFTPYSETRDAEEVRGMLTRYFERASEIVERFGGVVDKFIGDAVMAVWGAELAREDDAERGVRAALDLVDAVTALGEEIAVPELAARAGVLSGEASVGSGGNEKGLVVGDLVNTASRLQSIAEPGTVLVGASTFDLAQAAIEFQAAGTQTVKGKQLLVEAWRAIRVVAGRGGEGRSEGLVPPFVGREQELRLLKDLLQATGEEGRSRMLSIAGEGGIGKSRLIDEFRNYVDGLVEDVYWHRGRSPAYGDGVTFWALGEMVRRRCGIAETDDDHRTSTKLRTTLTEYVADADDRSWLEPRLAGLLGLGPMPTGDRAELFAAWRSFFSYVAQRGTTVMIFEDLQWADSGLIDFVDELTARTADRPILVLTLARPELLERQPGWGSGRANTMALHLAPLADAEVAELTSGMIPGVPDDLVAHIVETAGGIPLYAVELVRMLVNGGTVVERDGRYETVGDVLELAVPDSLHGVVGARIDQLGESERELLQDASVLGQSFTLTGLSALRGEEESKLEEQLEPLVQQQLLVIDQDPRSPERGQYQFVQSLIKEVAYSRMSRAERKDKHLAVAAHFEKLGDPELAGVVAAHFVGALEASPEGPEADQLADRALAALVTAAERAAELQSHTQAVSLSLQAIDVSRDESDAGPLWMRAAKSAHAMLDEHAEEYAQRAIDKLQGAVDPEASLIAAQTLANIYDDTNQSQQAVELLEPVVEATSATDTPAYARAAAELARAYMLTGRLEETLELAERALTGAEKFDLVPVVADAMITRGTTLGGHGRPREGLALLEAALRLAEEHDLGHALRRVLNNLSFLSASDAPRASLEYTQRRLEHARRIGEPRFLFDALIDHAENHASNGAWEEAIQRAEEIDYEALPRSDQLRVDDLERTRLMWQGEPVAAEERFREIKDEVERELGGIEDRQILNYFENQWSWLAFLNGRADEAYERSLALDDSSPNLYDVTVPVYAALFLGDRTRLEAVRERLATKTYRGRRIDYLGLTIEAGLQALAGDVDRAAVAFRDVADQMEASDLAIRTVVAQALAAKLLGTEHEIGRELAQTAYKTCIDLELKTVLDLIPEGVLAPEVAAAASAGA